MVSLSTDVSSENDLKHNSLHDRIKIVSQQSTARPGCIIQLDAISDATHVNCYWSFIDSCNINNYFYYRIGKILNFYMYSKNS